MSRGCNLRRSRPLHSAGGWSPKSRLFLLPICTYNMYLAWHICWWFIESRFLASPEIFGTSVLDGTLHFIHYMRRGLLLALSQAAASCPRVNSSLLRNEAAYCCSDNCEKLSEMARCVSLHTTAFLQYCAKTCNCTILDGIMQLSNVVHNSAVLQYFAETHPATQPNPILKVQTKENCACSPENIVAHHCGSSGISLCHQAVGYHALSE